MTLALPIARVRLVRGVVRILHVRTIIIRLRLVACHDVFLFLYRTVETRTPMMRRPAARCRQRLHNLQSARTKT